MLQPVKDIIEYKRIKRALKERFETEQSVEQSLFREQSKMLQPLIKPLISSQEQTVKAIQSSGTQELARELRRRNDQVGTSAQQPYYFDSVPSITAPQTSSPKKDYIKINLDSDLDETYLGNSQEMSFELPSLVSKNKQKAETLDKIETENRSSGQNWVGVRMSKRTRGKYMSLVRKPSEFINKNYRAWKARNSL